MTIADAKQNDDEPDNLEQLTREFITANDTGDEDELSKAVWLLKRWSERLTESQR